MLGSELCSTRVHAASRGASVVNTFSSHSHVEQTTRLGFPIITFLIIRLDHLLILVIP